jgi:hypothetical protein
LAGTIGRLDPDVLAVQEVGDPAAKYQYAPLRRARNIATNARPAAIP